MSKMTVRQKVFAYVKKQRNASAIQIGGALKMSAASVRHHLSILVAEGRIIFVGETRNDKRGRPVKVYRLSDKSLGDNLSILASALLKKIPTSKRQRDMHSLALELADEIGRTNPNDLFAKRINHLTDKLNEMQYQARWEAGAEGPRILFDNCPYAAIIEKHPELCQMDGNLLEEEIGAKARQIAKIDLHLAGKPHCIFVIT